MNGCKPYGCNGLRWPPIAVGPATRTPGRTQAWGGLSFCPTRPPVLQFTLSWILLNSSVSEMEKHKPEKKTILSLIFRQYFPCPFQAKNSISFPVIVKIIEISVCKDLCCQKQKKNTPQALSPLGAWSPQLACKVGPPKVGLFG